MRRRIILVLAALVALGAAIGVTAYARLTAPVAVSTAPPIAPTMAVVTLTPLPPAAAVVRATAPAPRLYRIDPAQSEAQYRVRETFFDARGAFTAIGKTQGIAGEILVDQAQPAASRVGEIVVDVSQLRSDDRDRDNALRNGYLQSGRYPLARLSNAAIRNLPGTLAEGQPFTFKLSGDLTVREVTRPVTWDVEATLDGDTLRASATTRVTLSEFGIQVPNLRILRAEDEATLALSVVARAEAAATTTTTPAVCEPTRNMAASAPTPDAPPRVSVGAGHVLRGVVRSSQGCVPVAGARLVFWLANPKGQYDDAGRASVVTDAAGEYRFESHFPGQYEGARPHIHIYALADGYAAVETVVAPASGATETRYEIVLAPARR